MSGTLFVVATPIGNLEDITLRALRVLREVDLIAAEDTRRTAKLLTHYGISTRTVSFHAHNTQRRLPELLTRLRAGDAVAIVSDAGTPGISDPGEDLIRASVHEGIRVEPVSGASAPLAALVVSGFPMLPVTVFGFPPSRLKARTDWLSVVCEIAHTFTFFEAPHRMSETLQAAASIMGERPIMVARELTKVHQEFLYGTSSELASRLRETRGELTVVVGPKKLLPAEPKPLDESKLAAEYWSKTKTTGVSRREVITQLAKEYHVSSKQIYTIVERSKRSGE